MSLKPEYGESVFSGSKTVELRNRIVRIEPGTTIWIYFTSPVSEIVGVADVRSVVYGSPAEIWRCFRKRMCIDRVRFEEYVGDRVRVTALVLKDVKKLDTPRADWEHTACRTIFPSSAVLFPCDAGKSIVRRVEWSLGKRRARRRVRSGYSATWHEVNRRLSRSWSPLSRGTFDD